MLGQLAYSMQLCFIKKSLEQCMRIQLLYPSFAYFAYVYYFGYFAYFHICRDKVCAYNPKWETDTCQVVSCPTRSALYWPLANCDDYPIQQIRVKYSIVMCYSPGRFRFRTSRRRLSGSNSRPGGFLHSIFLKRGILPLIEPLTHSPDHCSLSLSNV